MLSAILLQLPEVVKGYKNNGPNYFFPLLVSAYPYIKPWQVREAAFAKESSNNNYQQQSRTADHARMPDFDAFYYSYLSYLLDPEEGIDSARHNAELVEVCLGKDLGLIDFIDIFLIFTQG